MATLTFESKWMSMDIHYTLKRSDDRNTFILTKTQLVPELRAEIGHQKKLYRDGWYEDRGSLRKLRRTPFNAAG